MDPSNSLGIETKNLSKTNCDENREVMRWTHT